MTLMKNREDLRNEMLIAQKEQKILLGQRDLLLKNTPPNQNESLRITHQISKLRDFIKFAENTLKMSD